LVKEEVKSFAGINKPPVVNLHIANEADLFHGMLNNTIDLAVTQRLLTVTEIAHIQKQEDFNAKQHVFAKQAYVLIASEQFKSKHIDLSSVLSSMTQKQPHTIVVEASKSASVKFVMDYFHLNQQPQYLFAENGLNGMLSYLRSHQNAIGVLPYTYISDIYAQAELPILKGLKILSIANADSTVIAPSQSSIASGTYPLVNSIVLINANMKQKSGINFVNYLFKPSAQRLILKFGLVPVNFPGRELLIK
jgi:phosphate transport system substrate-binding protein